MLKKNLLGKRVRFNALWVIMASIGQVVAPCIP